VQNELHIRRTIGGRVYDTDTAVLVHVLSDDGGHIALDFHAERTALYRTRRGAFFIAGQSGACGRWKRYQNGGYSPGCGVELIGDTEARRLLEQAGGPVEKFFDVIEG
jgi:hypothetical protein